VCCVPLGIFMPVFSESHLVRWHTMLQELHILLRYNGNSVISNTHFPYEVFKYVNKYEFGDVTNWRYVRCFCLVAIPSVVTLFHRNLASAGISGHGCCAEGHNKGNITGQIWKSGAQTPPRENNAWWSRETLNVYQLDDKKDNCGSAFLGLFLQLLYFS
jgi:hypothetical protein